MFFISVQTRMAKKPGFGQNIYTTAACPTPTQHIPTSNTVQWEPA